PTICTTTTAATVTVNAVGSGTASPLAQTVCGSPAPITVTGFSGTVVKWQWSNTADFAVANDIAASASATLSSAQITALAFSGTRYFSAVLNVGTCPGYIPTVASVITV